MKIKERFYCEEALERRDYRWRSLLLEHIFEWNPLGEIFRLNRPSFENEFLTSSDFHCGEGLPLLNCYIKYFLKRTSVGDTILFRSIFLCTFCRCANFLSSSDRQFSRALVEIFRAIVHCKLQIARRSQHRTACVL